MHRVKRGGDSENGLAYRGSPVPRPPTQQSNAAGSGGGRLSYTSTVADKRAYLRVEAQSPGEGVGGTQHVGRRVPSRRAAAAFGRGGEDDEAEEGAERTEREQPTRDGARRIVPDAAARPPPRDVLAAARVLVGDRAAPVARLLVGVEKAGRRPRLEQQKAERFVSLVGTCRWAGVFVRVVLAAAVEGVLMPVLAQHAVVFAW